MVFLLLDEDSISFPINNSRLWHKVEPLPKDYLVLLDASNYEVFAPI